MGRLNTETEEMFREKVEIENPDYEPIDDEDFEPAQEAIPSDQKIKMIVCGEEKEFEQEEVIHIEL